MALITDILIETGMNTWYRLCEENMEVLRNLCIP